MNPRSRSKGAAGAGEAPLPAHLRSLQPSSGQGSKTAPKGAVWRSRGSCQVASSRLPLGFKMVWSTAAGRAEFVALTAVSPKTCLRPPSQMIPLDSSNHLLRLWNQRPESLTSAGSLFYFFLFFPPSPFLCRVLRKRDSASTSRRAINCEKKRSDRWTDGFGLLLPLPVHLSADEVRWGAAKEAKGNDLCQSIRADCSFTSTYKWGPLASTMSEQLDILCLGP